MKNVEDVYVASPMQQGLLFQSLSAPQTGAYFVQVVCEMQGALNAAVFRRAWERVLARHAILRTFFVWEEMSEVLQVVSRQAELPWQEHDWRGLSEGEQRERFAAFLAEDRARGFDLSRAPLMRLAVFRLDESTAKCVWSHHHLLLDGWSAFLLIKEVFDLYEAFDEGREAPAESAPLYRDYIAWLRRQDIEGAERFWRERLKSIAPAASILKPADGDGKAEQQTERQQLYLTERLTSELKSLARRHGLTPNTILQGAWAVVLSRNTGEPEVTLGVVVSGRPAELPGIESMIGPFINLLPLRVRVDGAAPLMPWLKELQAQHAEIRMYEYSPLAQVQAWSGLPRGAQLFESLMAFENYPIDTSFQERETKLRITGMSSVEQTNFPLGFVVVPGARFLLQLNYHASRLDAEAAKRLLGYVQTVLESVVAEPRGRLSDLSLMTEGERRRMLVEWNGTASDYPRQQTIQQLFESQVERTPNAPAVSFDGVTLSYRELNERANQLAHHLSGLGVGPESRVGVFMERGIAMIAGMLGILKAGAAYVPLDPSYPRERLRFMLEDAGLAALVTQRRLLDRLPRFGGHVVCADGAEIEGSRRDNPPHSVGGESLAYVIYTSGSTGRPKGISVVHRAVARLIFNTNYIEIGPSDHVAQASNASFDAATFEVWGALLNGARLVGVGRDVLLAPAEFAAQLRQGGISILFLTTALFNQMASEVPDAFAGVRCLLFGGEACEPKWVRTVLAAKPPQHLLHVYGPTESTTFATWYPVRDVAEGASTIPIGRPLSNTRTYILNRELETVPVGVPGELYIGGDGLARDYLNRPALTAERFIPDPFSPDPGARLYRTGDRARYLPEGDIEFLGRVDQQVKVRGFRIEPGEIEAVLRTHPSVEEAVVLVREEPGTERRLVAYVVSGAKIAPTPDELRDFLGRKLPEYMIPSFFVVMESLPLTPNGKIDRAALPSPDSVRPDTDYKEASNAAEQILVEIWKRVLGVSQVGIHDDFFALGGDSILSIQIAARASRAGVQLTPKQLFEHPNIAALVVVAGSVSASKHTDSSPAGDVPLTPIQHWFFESHPEGPSHFNQSALLRVRVGTDPELLRRVLQELLDHHDALRLRFTREGGRWSQRLDAREEVSFARVDLGVLCASEQREAIERESARAQAGLDITRGPLLRAVYFDLGAASEARLLIVIHHLAIDGVSWRVLLEDLSEGYEQLRAGHAVAMPEKTTSFKVWAEGLRRRAQREELIAEADYWAGQPWMRAVLLSVDGEAEEMTFASARHVKLSLTEDETKALLTEVVAVTRARIDEILLAALARAFAGWAGAGPVAVEVEGHGREEEMVAGADLSRTVGWFTTTYPLLLEVAEGESAAETLRRVKEYVRGVPSKGIGYGLLRYLSGRAEVEARMRSIPRPLVSFNYLGQFDQVVEPGGLILGGADESPGPAQRASGKLNHLISLNCIVTGGQLEASWLYSEQVYKTETVERLAQSFAEALREIIAHNRSTAAATYNASDFPLANLDGKKLGKLSSLFDKIADRKQLEKD